MQEAAAGGGSRRRQQEADAERCCNRCPLLVLCCIFQSTACALITQLPAAPCSCFPHRPPAENELEEEVREAMLARFKAHGRRGGAADQASPLLVLLPWLLWLCLQACCGGAAPVMRALQSSVQSFVLKAAPRPVPWPACLCAGAGGAAAGVAPLLLLWVRGQPRPAALDARGVQPGGGGSGGEALLHGLFNFQHPNTFPAALPLMNCPPVLPACLYCLQAKDFHRNLGELADQLVAQHAFHMAAEEVRGTARGCMRRAQECGSGARLAGCQPAELAGYQS